MAETPSSALSGAIFLCRLLAQSGPPKHVRRFLLNNPLRPADTYRHPINTERQGVSFSCEFVMELRNNTVFKLDFVRVGFDKNGIVNDGQFFRQVRWVQPKAYRTIPIRIVVVRKRMLFSFIEASRFIFLLFFSV